MTRILAITLLSFLLTACYLEGGGCSGPFCFAVGTDLCNDAVFSADSGNQCEPQSQSRCPDADDIQAIAIQEINRLRATAIQCGTSSLPPANSVVWSQVFFQAADLHALDMASNNFVAQIGSNGLGVAERVSVDVTFVTQAVAGGFADTRTLIAQWARVAEDCATLVDSRVTEVALACRYDDDSEFGQYWTLVAGRQ